LDAILTTLDATVKLLGVIGFAQTEDGSNRWTSPT
jgi:hypothetical protein